MTNNLWEIIKFDDLVFLLRNAEKRFIVLSIITEETDENIKKMIKVFIKEKSKIYPKVTFLFYKAKKSDFGKLDPMFDKDITKYPKIIHIWDVRDIMLGVMAIDNKEIMEKSFEEFHNIYLVGTLPNNKEESAQSDDSVNQKESYDDIESVEEPKKKKNVKIQTPQQSQQPKDQQKQQMQNRQSQILPPPPPPQPIPQQPYKDPEIEKKKFVEKIQLLRKKQEETIDKFVNEFKERKKEEEGGDKEKSKKRNKKK
jgi:hypothetical protein